jgi:hypothetical protein
VVVGTVPEYGSKASGKSELAAIGLNVRMIDVNDGSIVWSVSDTAISDRPISLSAFANRMVRNLVAQLLQEMIRVGDTQGTNVPTPVVINTLGKIRGAVIDIQPDSPRSVKGYKFFRSRTEKGPYREVGTVENTDSGRIQFEDRDLLDAETYYYKVYTVAKTDLTGFPTQPLRITTAGPPRAVTGLVAMPEFKQTAFAQTFPLVKTEKDTYKPGETIKVIFSDAPGKDSDWICIVPAGTPDTEAGDYKYMPRGLSQGSLIFDSPTPGKYEVRGYYDYRRHGYVVTGRYPFSVSGGPDY